jgi:hypothetical protein
LKLEVEYLRLLLQVRIEGVLVLSVRRNLFDWKNNKQYFKKSFKRASKSHSQHKNYFCTIKFERTGSLKPRNETENMKKRNLPSTKFSIFSDAFVHVHIPGEKIETKSK